MADDTTTEASLKDVLRAQSNKLYDVLALVAAVADRIEAHASQAADDDSHHSLRIAQLAQRQVNAVIDALDPFI